MKHVLALGLLFISFSASAEQTRPCTYQDYKMIQAMLSGAAQIKKGAELKGSLIGLLSEEMGPQCNAVLGLGGIPGNSYHQFLISGTEGRNFDVSIVIGGIESPGTRMTIEKK